ncbi:MAG: hypothetical protein J6Q81_01100 [Lentisphaeria bacterium]|nr:hypothetical protein [Lentisphaeria bacterium]
MARKSSEESPVSLFSFQDIITSITGIMFLVVLLLILIMLTSRPDNKLKSNENIKVLQQELATLKNKLQQLRSSSLEIDKQLEELKKLSPEEIERRKNDYRQQLRKEQIELEKLSLQVSKKSQQLKQLELEIEEMNKLVEARREIIKDMKIQLAENAKNIKQKKAILQQQNRVMKYVIQSTSPKRPVLAELDKDGIRLLETDKQKITDLRRPGKALESLSMLKQELGRFSSDQVYFSVAVKPGGFKYAMPLLNILKSSNFERGTEILPDDKTSIFEEPKP